jgi:hypothetical protein
VKSSIVGVLTFSALTFCWSYIPVLAEPMINQAIGTSIDLDGDVFGGPATVSISNTSVEFTASLSTVSIDLTTAGWIRYFNFSPYAGPGNVGLAGEELYVLEFPTDQNPDLTKIVGFNYILNPINFSGAVPEFLRTDNTFTLRLPPGTIIGSGVGTVRDAEIIVELLFEPLDNGNGPGGSEVPEPISLAIWSLLGVGAFGARRIWRPAAQ